MKNIVLNMEVVKYSDSSGLSALLVGNRLFKDTGSFVMCKLNEHVMKLISISQLDKVIDILPTVEEAIDAVMFNDIERGLREAGEE